MAKYLVETYYTCTFKVNHYLDDINENELKNLEKRDDGKFEIIDVKLDNRKTKNLDPNNNKIVENKNINIVSENKKPETKNLEKYFQSSKNSSEKSGSSAFLLNPFFRVRLSDAKIFLLRASIIVITCSATLTAFDLPVIASAILFWLR